MLTQEQIQKLKPGDKLALSHPLIFREYDSENDELLAINNGEYIYFHAVDVELPSEHGTSVPTPKHDPCRLFKKGDKVRVVEWNGRRFHDRDYGVDIETGCIAKIYESERDEPKKCALKVAYRHYLFTVPTCFLELVTPVEELEPYKLIDSPKTYNIVRDSAMVMTIHKKSHPNAKAAAEAERDRLNAEWRKEQK